MSTNERWAEGRPTRDSLPGINGPYQNEISDWLAAFPDLLLTGTKFKAVDDVFRQVDPLNCDEDWLDFLAPLCGWSEYWDRGWPTTSKRQLLHNSYSIIWPNYGSAVSLSFVLKTLGIPHVVQQGQSFLIGISRVGDPIGAVAFEYDIILPSSLFNSAQSRLTERINTFFGPIWCRSRILFEDEFFDPQGFPLIGDNTLIATDSAQTVLEL